MDIVELSRSLDAESSDTYITNTATTLRPEDANQTEDKNRTDIEDGDGIKRM